MTRGTIQIEIHINLVPGHSYRPNHLLTSDDSTRDISALFLSDSLSLGVAKMMKLCRLLEHSRNQLSRKPLNWKAGDVGDVLSLHALSYSTAGQNFATAGSTAGKIFAPYTIFKGKAALSVTPLLPTFTKLESGNLVVDRRGSMMLKFRPAIGERKYDNERRQIFCLSATEVGSLISLGADDSCEFFHDPSMLSSNAGQVRKSLSIKPIGNGSGYFVSLNVVNNIQKTKDNLSVPVSNAEFAVMKTACSFALPHIMGWDRLTSKMSRGTEGQTSSLVDRQMLSLEWDK